MTTEQKTCEERIAGQLAGRVQQIAAMRELVAFDDGAEELSEGALELLQERGMEDRPSELRAYDVQEAGQRAMAELPLGVSSYTVFRLDLSTGGPGDWFEFQCSGDTPNYEAAGEGEHYEIERVTYHFNDWFDHAERTLDGEEQDAAEALARETIHELMG